MCFNVLMIEVASPVLNLQALYTLRNVVILCQVSQHQPWKTKTVGGVWSCAVCECMLLCV